MPIKKAGKKALRHSKTREVYNTKEKEAYRSAVKKARAAITSGKKKEAEEAVSAAIKALDKSYAKGIQKKNTVARTKSRLVSALAKMDAKK
ncbi:30S ribosomal protein S20 [Patescibacteria group bacterium]